MLKVRGPPLPWSFKRRAEKVEVPGRPSRNPKSKELDTRSKSGQGAESLTPGRGRESESSPKKCTGWTPRGVRVPTVLQRRETEAVKVRRNGMSNKADLGVNGQRQQQLELAMKG